jgi:hypothetical protein
MTIWLLAIVLLASLAGLGYRQGAIRVAASFVGIVLAALLAVPVGHLLTRLITMVGVRNPILAWVLGPLIVFLLISFVSKSIGFTVHRKAEVHFRYRVPELRLALWERVNRRLGLCLGVGNGFLYLILISWVIYAFSYWTIQVSSDTYPNSVRVLNLLGRDLHKSGFAKVARAVDRMPAWYYELADLSGTLYRNPQAKKLVEHYPGFLSLVEREEIKALLNDKDFNELWQKPAPIKELLDNPKVHAIIYNQEQFKTIGSTVLKDLDDFIIFLTSGQSPKYSPEKILGYWDVNTEASLSLLVRARPSLTTSHMQLLRSTVPQAFSKTVLIAMPDGTVLVKEVPPIGVVSNGGSGSSGATQTLHGQWTGNDSKYQVSVSDKDQNLTGIVEGDRLVLKGAPMEVVFEPEN